MPRKQKITLSTEEERQIRAARKEDRTSWKTGATDEQKATAIDRAFGDKQRYVWMQKVNIHTRIPSIKKYTTFTCDYHSSRNQLVLTVLLAKETCAAWFTR